MITEKHSLNPDFIAYWYILCCFTFVNWSCDTHWSTVLCWNASITSWFLQCVPGHTRYSGECFLPEWGLSEPPGHVPPPPPSPGYQLDPPLRSPPSAGCHSCRLPARQPPATSATTQRQHFVVTAHYFSSKWCEVVYLLYDGNGAWGHGDHGGDSVISLWTEFSDLLDINWTKTDTN